jgi:hypothetical protein
VSKQRIFAWRHSRRRLAKDFKPNRQRRRLGDLNRGPTRSKNSPQAHREPSLTAKRALFHSSLSYLFYYCVQPNGIDVVAGTVILKSDFKSVSERRR